MVVSREAGDILAQCPHQVCAGQTHSMPTPDGPGLHGLGMKSKKVAMLSHC